MPTILLTIEYDGTRYHGWQRQPSVPTIQGILEDAVAMIAREAVTVTGAGRTDAGVHALGQTAHFVTQAALEPEVWRRALNAVLPSDIAIIGAERVAEDVHARFSAHRKLYRYAIFNRMVRSPLLCRTAWHVPTRLRLPRMRRAALHLTGVHDFRAFRAADPTHTPSDDTVCRITRCVIARRADLVTIEIAGNRFLKYMIRNVVGTLVAIGTGKRDPDEMSDILRSGDRRQAGVTAPAHGLTLVAVHYDGTPARSAKTGPRR